MRSLPGVVSLGFVALALRVRGLLTVGLGEDFVGCPCPREGAGAGVPAVDEPADLAGEVADRGERAAVDGLPLGQGEPDLDQIHPGGVGRVKCTWTRGFASSQAFTAGCLW